jgi:hypothetical protein
MAVAVAIYGRIDMMIMLGMERLTYYIIFGSVLMHRIL